MIKIKFKLKKFFKQMFCKHNRLITRLRRSEDDEFIILDCLDCGKTFVQKNK